MTKEDLIIQTLHNSTLTEELRDSEIDQLASLISVRDYKAGEYLLKPGDAVLKDALLILGAGDVEATANTGGEQMTLHMLQPGDLAGIIGFVGIMVPHMMRLVFGSDHRLLLPAAVLFGASFLVAADTVARVVLAPAELPVGVITALCGAPYFIFLLKRKAN